MENGAKRNSQVIDASAEVLARKQTEQGYVRVWGHFAGSQRAPVWVWEHRLVVQQLLGRPLVDEEAVHHRDLDCANNALVNLVLLPTPVHLALHRALACGLRFSAKRRQGF